ncbi:XTP/dITP diphosphatase [Candidatus Bathyarchaeota archaeon]|nr:XTP/dITP diphosphatase [Candidatus Bathyarchaeota archaeon]MBS7627215.1 XTP/dITP diphosphatase [Candidatus Bathyarchaeota archaeon]
MTDSEKKPRTDILSLATKNPEKFKEVEFVLSKYGIGVRPLAVDRIEIQSDSLEVIALFGAKDLFHRLKIPILVEDAGLFIESLNGFPGPYSSFVFKTLGIRGVLKLMEGIDRRDAIFRSAVAYCDETGEAFVFKGEVKGLLVKEARGKHWGFDPIFQPLEGDGRTFAEMGIEEKCAISHRGRALRAFGDFYRKSKG